MKNRMYRIESFSPFDLQDTEAHLSAMAAKGWQLESIGRFLWKYRWAEPAAIHYAVTCPPAAEENGDMRDRLYFEELCAAAGWEKATDWEQMQVYVNQAQAPTPLETDEAIRLESVHQSMRQTYLRSCRNNLLSDLLLLVLWLSNLRARLHTSLLSGIILSVPLICLLMVLANTLSIAGYFSWYRRSRRSVGEGGGLAAVPRFYRAVNRLPAAILALLLLSLLSLGFRTGTPQSAPYLIICSLTGGLAAALVWGVNRFFRKRGCDGFTRAAAVILSLLALLAVLSGLVEGLNLSQRLRFSAPNVPSYTWDGETWDLEPHPLPLTVRDLTGEDWPHVRRTARSQGRTPFASEMVYTEAAAQEDGTRVYLHYVITDIPNDRLCHAVLNDMRNGPSFLQYQAEDPSPWGAEATYRLYYPDGRAADEWLIQWPGRVAAVRAENLDLGREEIAVIGARLAPEAGEEDAR